jgi:hypothetical protein
MNTNLSEKLEKDFADYLTNHNGYCIGFECGDGWEPLIREALTELKMNNCNVVFQQIKEKFGSIRMYYYSKDDYNKLQVNYDKIKLFCNKILCIINTPFFKLKLYEVCNFSHTLFNRIENFIGLRIFRFKFHIAENIIRKAEIKSCHTCEGCSKPAKIQSINGWYTCICDDCLIVRNKTRGN